MCIALITWSDCDVSCDGQVKPLPAPKRCRGLTRVKWGVSVGRLTLACPFHLGPFGWACVTRLSRFPTGMEMEIRTWYWYWHWYWTGLNWTEKSGDPTPFPARPPACLSVCCGQSSKGFPRKWKGERNPEMCEGRKSRFAFSLENPIKGVEASLS